MREGLRLVHGLQAIFGESAGAFSVCWHLAAPGSKGLFQAAIMESGTCDSPQFFRDLTSAYNFSALYAASLGCNSTSSAAVVACLRTKSTEDMLKSIADFFNPDWPFTGATEEDRKVALRDVRSRLGRGHKGRRLGEPVSEAALIRSAAMSAAMLPAFAPVMPWGVALDGAPGGLGNMPIESFLAGQSAGVNVIMGTNADEFMIFVPILPIVVKNTTFPPDDGSLVAAMLQMWQMYDPTVAAQVAQEVLVQYPAEDYKDSWWRASAMMTEMFFTCATRRAARALQGSCGVQTYLYHFEYPTTFEAGLEYDLLGDYHTSELDFVWSNGWPPILHDLDANDITLADAMGRYWTAMARSGSPVDPEAPIVWPANNASSDLYAIFSNPVSVEADLLAANCNWWDSAIAKLEASTQH
jgi:para-nitrobenzyl esterase